MSSTDSTGVSPRIEFEFNSGVLRVEWARTTRLSRDEPAVASHTTPLLIGIPPTGGICNTGVLVLVGQYRGAVGVQVTGGTAGTMSDVAVYIWLTDDVQDNPRVRVNPSFPRFLGSTSLNADRLSTLAELSTGAYPGCVGS
jgi:hypothetical protein